MDEQPQPRAALPVEPPRRGFLTLLSRLAMAAGLLGGYGGFAAIAARYLYPSRSADRRWQFVAVTSALGLGEAAPYVAPSGERITVMRQGGGEASGDFLALSSTCPHLGCQVHWEPHNRRYFCPCHNGVFDPSGTATAGPPYDAGQSLPRYALRVDRGRLFIDVTTDRLVSTRARRGSTGV